MSKYWTWEKAAKICKKKYGVFVSSDGWFECPECGEPILKEDWEDENLIHCPVCEYNFDTDKYDDEDWEDEIYNCD